MHVFHKYSNWVHIGDRWVFTLTSSKLVRLWQGECETCGRPKIMRRKIANYG